jgi:hypothetical protein
MEKSCDLALSLWQGALAASRSINSSPSPLFHLQCHLCSSLLQYIQVSLAAIPRAGSSALPEIDTERVTISKWFDLIPPSDRSHKALKESMFPSLLSTYAAKLVFAAVVAKEQDHNFDVRAFIKVSCSFCARRSPLCWTDAELFCAFPGIGALRSLNSDVIYVQGQAGAGRSLASRS